MAADDSMTSDANAQPANLQPEATHTNAATNAPEKKSESPPEDAPPDGGYGWVCVACAAVINANTWGVNSSYGVFLSHYLSTNVFPGMSPIAYAITGGLSISSSLLISPAVTHMIHLYGNQTTLNAGAVIQACSFIAASFVTKNWQLFLSQGVCFGCGMGLIFVSSVNIVPQWFARKRSLTMSIAASGSGFGGLIYSLAAGAMIPRLGLAWTFRTLGIVTFVVNMVAGNLLRDRNKAIGSRYHAFRPSLVKRPEFLLLQAWGFFTLLGYVVLLFSLPNFALTIGLSPKQGSIIAALLNLGQGIGRPVVGLVSDRYGRITMAVILTLITAIFCFAIWIPAMSMAVTCVFAVLVGTVAGTYWATVVPICAEVIGMQDLPSGLSITWIAMVIPTTVSEAIGVALKNNSGGKRTYLYAQIFTALVYTVAAVCLWILRGWKVGENERVAREKVLATSSRSDGLIEDGTESKETNGVKIENEDMGMTGAEITPWSLTQLPRRMIARGLV